MTYKYVGIVKVYCIYLVSLLISSSPANAFVDQNPIRYSNAAIRIRRKLETSTSSSCTVKAAFIVPNSSKRDRDTVSRLHGWLDNFLPAPMAENDDSKRRSEFPEQYPATYDLLNEDEVTDEVSKYDTTEESKIARLLLKNTMLEQRRLQTVYDADIHGWNAASFHQQVDGKGAAVIIATLLGADGESKNVVVGGYNPKGWSSTGGARPSVAAFVFYELKAASTSSGRFQKLQKVGGGGLACARDDPDYGISLGPDALVIPLQEGRERMASSKLGPYYERGPEERSSLFEKAGVQIKLTSLKILTGVYDVDEEIPYTGAVLDMTSG